MSWEGPRYQDRSEAGLILAGLLEKYTGQDVIVLAIPNGGVAVAGAIAQKLGSPLDLLVVRKIQFPGNTEAGFGAVSADGTTVIDEQLVARLGLSPEQVEAQRRKAWTSVKERLARYGSETELTGLVGKNVILIDDGLATGATMETAVYIVKKHDPAKVVVATPTASARAYRRLESLADELICPHIGKGPVFAVANAYVNWYDVSDEEVISLIKSFKANL